MKTILVTGANGFLAANTILELLARGYKVKGMLRKGKSPPVAGNGFTPFYGKITSEKDVSEAVKGCYTVIHVAALTDQSVPCKRVYNEVNINGTLNIVKASVDHKIKKLVLISTANVFGHGTKDRPGNETMPMRPPFTRSYYALSKAQAQQLALDSLKDTQTALTVVCPTFMTGPNDHKISSNRIILRALNRRILFIPPGGKNFIHVKDAAAGICNALTMGKNGECYLLANENLTYREFYNKMAGVSRNRTILVTIPKPLLYIAGLAGSLARAAGVKTPVSLVNMQILCTGNYYSSAKAVKEIKLPQTPVAESIRETIEWFAKPIRLHQAE